MQLLLLYEILTNTLITETMDVNYYEVFVATP